MASFRKVAGGKWRAEVARKGVRTSKIFASKQAAKDWAARQEYLILHDDSKPGDTLFRDVLIRYANEVSPKKRGARWEMLRLRRFEGEDFASVPVAQLQPKDFAAWRDKRLREVAPGSVNREMTLLSAVLTVARREWGLIDVNPISDVRKPTKPPARERLPTEAEIERMLFVAGEDLSTATARAFHCFRFALETAMRAGEIARLRHEDISGRVARLHHTKNGHPRDVPLSSAALALLAELPPLDPAFGLQPRQIDVLFRRVRDKAGITGLTFHDSRAYAITHLARKLDILELAKVVGHKDLRMLQVYYRATAEELADRLD
nr:site-specific integrase [uncultured Roseovarius sp.]